MEKETDNTPAALNYEAANHFSTDLLNPNYYANLKRKRHIGSQHRTVQAAVPRSILSENNERSCASCHNPDRAFTDGHTKSLAINGEGHIQRTPPYPYQFSIRGALFLRSAGAQP